ncbi:MAG TPA: TRAP transporter substrate-binding protein DctP [Stellaceae bacterium]|jgi:TRAP-type C4-dicarboxylate transport system substrate-binding protein|nr:TRAP transporter substrate-binding protein DctP [Stellaceae bacterium]
MTARLDIAFHAPAHSTTFTAGVKPFADVVMRDAQGTVAIALHPEGARGGSITTQLQLLESGGADAAFVIPGFTPERFPDNFVFGIPGLFRDITEATLTYSRVVGAGVLRGYNEFHVIGAFCTEPFTLHAAKKLTCLADLNGMKLRAANSADEIMLKQLGAAARIVPGDRIVAALASGEIDGTTLHIGPLYDLGVDRVTSYDYLLRLGCAPLLILMSRRSLDRLPAPAQAAILRHSGEAYAQAYARRVAAHHAALLAKLKADRGRIRTEPTAAEVDAANRAFQPVVDAWLAEDARNARILDAVKSEVAKLRAGA